MSVLTAASCLRQVLNWSFMFVFTLVQSRTHVDTVQTVLHGISNSRYICWSHTVKVLGSHVTFVRRNSTARVTLKYTYVVMKVWSHMFAVNVQRVSVQQMNWDDISWCTWTSNTFAVARVAKISDRKLRLLDTSTNVVILLLECSCIAEPCISYSQDVCLFVTLTPSFICWLCVKMMQAKITKSTPMHSPKTLVLAI